MSFRIVLFFIFFLSFNNLSSVMAQSADLLQKDLSNTRADQISDEQLIRFIRYADARNLSDQQIEAGALSRNMVSTEVDKLMSRIQQLRARGGRTTQNQNNGQKISPMDSMRQQTDSQRDTSLNTDLTSEEKKIFGFDLFNSKNLSFEPSLDIATPKNYQIGPGDELLINIWGASRQTYSLEVNRDGTVVIDNLGPVYVNGQTIEAASQRIVNRLTEIYSGLKASPERPANTFAEVTLGQVRSIKVTIVGEVRKPGTYTLPSLATAFNALYLSGGPNVIGSFRDIEIVRNNQVAAKLDVYDFLLGGKKTQNINLKDQDVIRVVPYDTRIELTGQVKRPGYYEMKKGESLAEAFHFSGGFTDNAYTHRFKVIRKSSREKRIEDVEEDNLKTFMPKNGDEVQVDSILDRFENRVEIYGAVYRPGAYALKDSMTLIGLLDKAEGLREDAFTKRVIIYRKDDNLSDQVLSVDLHKIKAGTVENIFLKREDIVRILSLRDLEEEYNVQISGEVQAPGTFPFMYDMTLEDLIAMAGGLKESASKARVEVARRVKGFEEDTTGTDGNGNIENLKVADIYQFKVNDDLGIDPASARFTLQPFDQIFIRRSPGYAEQRTVYVKGEVTYPGAYTIQNKDENISDMINRAGGLTSYAYTEGAKLIRLNPAFFKEKAKREDALKDSLKMLQFRKYFNDSSPDNQPGNTTTTNVTPVNPVGEDDDLYQQDQMIRQASVPKYKIREPLTQNIGIDLQTILSHPASKYDIRLMPGDTLEIPKELETVRMSGQVLYPVSSRYDMNKNFKSYISEAGGFAKEADRQRSYIIYANGAVDRTRSFLFIKNYPDVKPGAEIVVPRKPERNRLGVQQLAIISTALASLSLVIIRVTDVLGN